MSREFRDHLITRGFDTAETPSGSDCVLIYDARGYNFIEPIIITAASAGQLYANRENLGIDLTKIYESHSGSNWAAKLNNNTADSKVSIFKINSYRTDINGPIGLQFVETEYGDDNFSIYIPYNYTEDSIDTDYPAFILNKNLRRVVISTATRSIQYHIKDCNGYFNRDEIKESPDPHINTNVHVVEIGSYDTDFTIIDTRVTNTKNWGTFEHPSEDLKMLIRLLIRAGWMDNVQYNRNHVYRMNEDLGIKESSKNIYGFEIIRGEIRRFTKYSDELWVEIDPDYGGFQFIKPKEQFIYEKPIPDFRRPRDRKKILLTADVIVKMNSPEKGIYFMCFNLEENYIFTTIGYNILDVLNDDLPQYEVESIGTC